jgi:hypothetical protein
MHFLRLAKLEALLRDPCNWPKTDGSGKPIFLRMDSWMEEAFELDRRFIDTYDNYGDQVYSPPKDIKPLPPMHCGTTVCACGLYATAYPKEGLTLEYAYGSGLNHNGTLKLRPDRNKKASREHAACFTINPRLRHKDSTDFRAAERFFGLENWSLINRGTQLAYYFFDPQEYESEVRHDNLFVADRIHSILELVSNPPARIWKPSPAGTSVVTTYVLPADEYGNPQNLNHTVYVEVPEAIEDDED